MTIRDLKSQYTSLDEHNIPDFVWSVRGALQGDEILNIELRSYLDELIDGFEPEGRRICVERSVSAPDKAALAVGCEVLACQLLVLWSMQSQEALRERILLFLQYAAVVVNGKYDFVGMALKVLSYKMTTLGLDWTDVREALSLDVLIYKFISNSRFSQERLPVLQYPVRGSVEIRDGRLTISTTPGTGACVEAFRTARDCVSVVSRNIREEKLKESERNDAGALAAFASKFLSVLNGMPAHRIERRAPANGDTVDIMYRWSEDEGCYYFQLLDDDYPFRGQLVDEELVAGLSSKELEDYIYEGDCIAGAKLVRDGDDWSFSIRSCYKDFAVRKAKEVNRANRGFYARVTHVQPDIQRISWMTPFGFGAVSKPLNGRDVREGDVFLMEMMSVLPDARATYINIKPWMHAENGEPVRMGEDNQDVLQDFLKSESEIRARQEQDRKALAAGNVPLKLLNRLASILISSAHVGPSLEQYRMLLAAAFLCRMTGNEERLQALLPEAFWLRCRLCFAQGAPVPSECPYGELPAERQAILASLSAFSGEAPDGSAEVTEGDAAALAGAYRVAQLFPDEVRTDARQVRKKICVLLDVQDAFREQDAVRPLGKYGVERQTVEFKSSYVMNIKAKKADVDRQGRGEVFQAVCGFLNADGGTVYLGVNDAGEPIKSEGYGLKYDMDWLCTHFTSIKIDRKLKLGYTVEEPKTLDRFVLFLRSEKELYFDESVQGLITIEPTEDADAIRFVVRPSEYEIAYLYSDKRHIDGVAYVRDGNSTIPMSDLRKRLRLMSLKSIDKEMDFVVTIKEAIDRHQKLIFRDYASGNSGKIEDRHVVPINLMYNDENVYCYDLDAHKDKQFRICRIASIVPDGDEPYPLPADIKPKVADVFRWADDDLHHIRIRMEVRARNYLLEEYSNAKNLPPEEFYPDPEIPDKWILDTHLHGFGAIRRFYLGLADKVEILDTEDSDALKADIREYMTKYLQDFI